MKKAVLNIDGYIGGADIMSLFSGEKTFNLSVLKDFLATLEPDVTDLHVYINSGGGSVVEGWAIHDKLKASGYKITTIGEGIVGSIATVIFMAGSDRKLHENTSFFIHNPYWQPDSPTPMEAKDLSKLANELDVEEKKILDFYAKVTGSSVDTIAPLMKEATSLTSQQAIDLGFANSIITENIQASKYKLIACVNNHTNKQKTMESKIIDAINEGFKKIFALKPNFKNMDVMGTNSNGENVSLYIESETGDIAGKNIFTVASDGTKTPAPDGEYTLESGKIVDVSGGVISEVKDPQMQNNKATLEELQAKVSEFENKINELTTERDNLKTELQNKSTELSDFQNNFKAATNELESIKKVVIGAGYEFDASTQEFKNTKQTKPSGFGEFAKSQLR